MSACFCAVAATVPMVTGAEKMLSCHISLLLFSITFRHSMWWHKDIRVIRLFLCHSNLTNKTASKPNLPAFLLQRLSSKNTALVTADHDWLTLNNETSSICPVPSPFLLKVVLMVPAESQMLIFFYCGNSVCTLNTICRRNIHCPISQHNQLN